MDENQIEEIYPDSYGVMALAELMDNWWSFHQENYINQSIYLYP